MIGAHGRIFRKSRIGLSEELVAGEQVRNGLPHSFARLRIGRMIQWK